MQITLGQCLLLYRNKRGLTHKELGARVFPELSAPHQKIKKIESGVYEPKPAELTKLAKALEVSVTDLRHASIDTNKQDNMCFNEEVHEMFPNLKESIKIVNSAVHMQNEGFALEIAMTILKSALATVEKKQAEYLEKQKKLGIEIPTQLASKR